ncbi:MAG: TetR/AcrR family transcriptional regulator [Alphaproteobacteria bacterium]|nr:TetR/AcrR family transcriptional regulator [Alphaproteobacteria bacterium]
MSALPRTQRRTERNRAAILSAAEALFGARGVEAVSIDEIADAADLAKGTLYNHFADKDALAAEIARTARHDGEARVSAANHGVTDPVRRTVRGIIVFARFAQERPERARALLRMTPRASDPGAGVNAGLRADIAAGIASGAFAAGDAETATLSVLGVGHILIARIVDSGAARTDAEAIAAALGGFVLRGLGLPAARANRIAAAEAADIFKEG